VLGWVEGVPLNKKANGLGKEGSGNVVMFYAVVRLLLFVVATVLFP